MFIYHLQNAFRGIRRAPVSASVVVASIALGISVSMTMIAFYNGMNVAPIPHKAPEVHRVLLDNWLVDKPFAEPNLAPPAIALQDFTNLRRAGLAVTDAAHFHATTYVTLQQSGIKQRVKASTRATTHGFFTLFETPMLYGGGWDLTAENNREAVVVIAKSLNERLFGGASSIGQEIEINGKPFRIAGVLDEWGMYPLYYDMTREDLVGDDVFIPFDIAVESLELWPSFSASPVPSDSTDFSTSIAGGETAFVQYWVEFANEQQRAAYQSHLDAYLLEQRQLGRFPRLVGAELPNVDQWIDRQQEGGNQRVFVQTLVVISLLFFGICLLNIITLLISRAMGNAGQVAVQRALGVPKSAIFFQQLLEASLLGVVGGTLGLILARFGVGLLGPLFLGADEGGSGSSSSGGLSFESLLDSSMLLSGVGIAVFGALLVAIYPTWKVCRVSPTYYLKAQ